MSNSNHHTVLDLRATDTGSARRSGAEGEFQIVIDLDQRAHWVETPVQEVVEAEMPEEAVTPSPAGRLRDAAWMLAAATVVSVFVGLPLTLAGWLLLGSAIAGTILALSILVLCGVVITATMQATTNPIPAVIEARPTTTKWSDVP
jgi:hypothetical protein